MQQNSSLNINQCLKLSIGLIGDSWVTGKKLDEFIANKFNLSGFEVDVISLGHSGAKSSLIYQNLISSELLSNSNIYYIVVIAGVNDAAGHAGSIFYTRNMINIIKAINSHNKYPIIIELPEFDITHKLESTLSNIKKSVFKIIFDKGKTHIINDYRNSLKSSLMLSCLKHTILPFKAIASNHNAELYLDSWHLNKNGNMRLGNYIADSIINLQTQITPNLISH